MAKTPDIFERKWPTVILTPIGVANHIVTVSSTDGLHTQQIVTLRLGANAADFKIKRVLSNTEIQVGQIDKDFNQLDNPIQFNGGTLEMQEQERNKMGWEIVGRAVYQEEPAVALRTFTVDQFGQGIDSVNRGLGSEEQPEDPNRIDPLGLNRIAVDAYISNMPNGIVPDSYDEIFLDRDPLNKNIVVARFLLQNQLIRQLNIDYDIDDDLIHVKQVV